MWENLKCPKCGSTHVQLSSENSRHGCLWFLLLGWLYFFWAVIRAAIGVLILLFYDWYMAMSAKALGKGYVWQSRRWLCGKKRVYYCHNCHHNFRG